MTLPRLRATICGNTSRVEWTIPIAFVVSDEMLRIFRAVKHGSPRATSSGAGVKCLQKHSGSV
jgi:hypothetical protein